MGGGAWLGLGVVLILCVKCFGEGGGGKRIRVGVNLLCEGVEGWGMLVGGGVGLGLGVVLVLCVRCFGKGGGKD